MKNKRDKSLLEKIDKSPPIDEDKFFKYAESLVDARKFNNIQKWLDKKGITAIKKYKEPIINKGEDIH